MPNAQPHSPTLDATRRSTSNGSTALADRFATLFREEHRAVRDVLLDLLTAFPARDRAAITAGLVRCSELTGPHFRYEEERMYPALVQIFGPDYIEAQYRAHDGAIAAARGLLALTGKRVLTDADVAEARRLLLVLLPHVSDCEGLSIMVERLPEADVHSILDARARSRREGLNLLDWADRIRTRPAAASV
jgi:hypothetical protein